MLHCPFPDGTQKPQPLSRATLDVQLQAIAQTKGTYPDGEIRSLEELAQKRKDLYLRPEREIAGRVIGYTQGDEEALFQRIGGSLVRLDTRGRELLKIGKKISYDIISRSVSLGPELELWTDGDGLPLRKAVLRTRLLRQPRHNSHQLLRCAYLLFSPMPRVTEQL